MVKIILAVFVVLTVVCLSTSAPERTVSTRCTSDSQCAGNLSCKNRQCQNPCIDKMCASNADCSVSNHRAICSCKKGFSGHPLTECKKEERCTYNPDCPLELSCRYGKCVDACATECPNRRKCQVISHVPFCDE